MARNVTRGLLLSSVSPSIHPSVSQDIFLRPPFPPSLSQKSMAKRIFDSGRERERERERERGHHQWPRVRDSIRR